MVDFPDPDGPTKRNPTSEMGKSEMPEKVPQLYVCIRTSRNWSSAPSGSARKSPLAFASITNLPQHLYRRVALRHWRPVRMERQPSSHRCQPAIGLLQREIGALAWAILRSGPRYLGFSAEDYAFSPSQSHCRLVVQTWHDRHCPDAQRSLDAPQFLGAQAPHVLLEHRIASGVDAEKAAVLNPKKSKGLGGAKLEHRVRPTIPAG